MTFEATSPISVNVAASVERSIWNPDSLAALSVHVEVDLAARHRRGAHTRRRLRWCAADRVVALVGPAKAEGPVAL